MRKRLLIALVAVVIVLLGLAAAFLVVTTRKPPAGKLDTALTGVSVATRTTPPPVRARPGGRGRRPACWPMFGGDPQRSLARPDIHIGIPVGPALGARAEESRTSQSYCYGVLYVNTFKADMWALDAVPGLGSSGGGAGRDLSCPHRD